MKYFVQREYVELLWFRVDLMWQITQTLLRSHNHKNVAHSSHQKIDRYIQDAVSCQCTHLEIN